MITVINMISFEESKIYNDSIRMLGGFFKEGMRWNDFIDIISIDKREYCEALKKYVIDNKIKITGEQRQNLENCVPLFSDNTTGSFSFCAWGDFMAAVWSTEEDKDYNYMDFCV